MFRDCVLWAALALTPTADVETFELSTINVSSGDIICFSKENAYAYHFASGAIASIQGIGSRIHAAPRKVSDGIVVVEATQRKQSYDYRLCRMTSETFSRVRHGDVQMASTIGIVPGNIDVLNERLSTYFDRDGMHLIDLKNAAQGEFSLSSSYAIANESGAKFVLHGAATDHKEGLYILERMAKPSPDAEVAYKISRHDIKSRMNFALIRFTGAGGNVGVDVTNDGNRVVAWCGNGFVHFDTTECSKVYRVNFDDEFMIARVSNDGKHIAYGGSQLRILDIERNQTVVVDKLNSELLSSGLKFAPLLGQEAFVAELDYVVEWNTRSHLAIQNMQFLDNGNLLVLTGSGEIIVYEANSWSIVKRVDLFPNSCKSRIQSLLKSKRPR